MVAPGRILKGTLVTSDTYQAFGRTAEKISKQSYQEFIYDINENLNRFANAIMVAPERILLR